MKPGQNEPVRGQHEDACTQWELLKHVYSVKFQYVRFEDIFNDS